MAFYKGSEFANWNNSLFIGALRAETLVRLELKGDKVVHEERLLQKSIGRIRDVRLGPDQFIYLLTDERAGGLYRLEPSK
jgi:glucose/arabinose dehydrogenase